MSTKKFPATTPEDAYRPDRHNNPVQPEDMLYCLLWRAKAHLLMCLGDDPEKECLANIREQFISRAILSVVGMLEQAKKTIDYIPYEDNTVAEDEVLVKLKIAHHGITRIDRKTITWAAKKLLQTTGEKSIKDESGEDRLLYIDKFTIRQG